MIMKSHCLNLPPTRKYYTNILVPEANLMQMFFFIILAGIEGSRNPKRTTQTLLIPKATPMMNLIPMSFYFHNSCGNLATFARIEVSRNPKSTTQTFLAGPRSAASRQAASRSAASWWAASRLSHSKGTI